MNTNQFDQETRNTGPKTELILPNRTTQVAAFGYIFLD
jgi:hypothetical protein